MNKFLYSKNKINELIDEYNLKRVCMRGTLEALKKLKLLIEKFYDDHIFYLDYWQTDACYFGWSWSEHRDELSNQKAITEGITQKFLEIYALILCGLGEKIEKENT